MHFHRLALLLLSTLLPITILAETRVVEPGIIEGDRWAALTGESITLAARIEARVDGEGPFCPVGDVAVAYLVDGIEVAAATTTPLACDSPTAPNAVAEFTIPAEWNGRTAFDLEVVGGGAAASATIRISVVGRADSGGLWDEILSNNRRGGEDLASLLANGVSDHAGNTLDETNRRIIVGIHGWNGSPTSGPWPLFHDAIVSRLPEGWSYVAYDWRNDAADSVFREQEQFGARRVSTRGYQHGIALAEALVSQIGEDQIEAVHLIGHSAGSWVVYSAAAHLAAITPDGLAIQTTYLDPFVPDMLAAHPFTRAILESSPGVANPWGTALGADMYWAQAGLPGTDHPVWNWNPDLRALTLRTDLINVPEASGWTGHDGPVHFYTSSIIDPDLVLTAGWAQSLALNEFAPLGDLWILSE